MKRNVCCLSVFLLLGSMVQGCGSSRQVLLKGEISEAIDAKIPIAFVEIEAPKKGEWIFETQYKVRIRKYTLKEDARPIVRNALMELFEISETSPYHLDVVLHFTYELLQTKFTKNNLGIETVMSMKMKKGDETIHERQYRSENSEWYSTGWHPFPEEDIFNRLFMASLEDVVRAAASDENLRQFR